MIKGKVKIKELKPRIREIRKVNIKDDNIVEKTDFRAKLSKNDFSHSFGEGGMSSTADLGSGFRARTLGGEISGGKQPRVQEFSIENEQTQKKKDQMRYAPAEAERRDFVLGGLSRPADNLNSGDNFIKEGARFLRNNEPMQEGDKYKGVADSKTARKRDRRWEG